MRGKTFIISGPSGVGKSTVLSALLEIGTLRPEEVEVTEIRQNA